MLETPDSLTIEASEATEVTELVRLLKLLKQMRLLKLLKLLRRLKLVRPLKLVKLLELAWWPDKEAGHTLNVNAPVFRPTRPACLPVFDNLEAGVGIVLCRGGIGAEAV